MNAYDPVTVGRRIREIRLARGKSQEAIAGLAGISPALLSLYENGKKAIDRRSHIEGIARALEIAPSEITSLQIPVPGNGATDAAIDAVRRAIQSVDMGAPGGDVRPAEQLAARITTVLDAKQRCKHAEVGLALPGLIRDLHSSIYAGRNDAALLRLACELHPQGTQAYLHGVGAPADLCWSAVRLAAQAAERLDEPVPLGIAAFGMANGQLSWGGTELAAEILSRIEVSTGDDPQLAGMLMLTRSLVAATENRDAESHAALDEAAGIAEHVGEGNAHFMSFGPTNVAAWRVSAALEAGEHERAAEIAEAMHPDQIVVPTRLANYYVNLGRAVGRLPGRRDDAVRAFRTAERISPDKLHRNPYARDVLVELLTRARDDTVGRDLRGLAYRAGLPV